MFKSMKRMIRWAGKYKGRLYLGSVCSFFSSLSTAIPTMAAAFALDKAIQAYWTNTAIDTVFNLANAVDHDWLDCAELPAFLSPGSVAGKHWI